MGVGGSLWVGVRGCMSVGACLASVCVGGCLWECAGVTLCLSVRLCGPCPCSTPTFH